MRMMRFFSILFFLSMIFLAGCGSRQVRQPPLREEDPQIVRHISWELLDYKGKADGSSVLPWVQYYLENNILHIENIYEFRDYFVFIASNTGSNFNALQQWMNAFSPDLDFPRLAAVRMENRFLNAAVLYPDDEYGSFYEAMIRAASDAHWQGAVRVDDFWVYRSFVGLDDPETELPVIWERYEFLILVIVEKNIMVPQIEAVLQNVQPPSSLSRYQRNAVNSVIENFLDGF